MNKKILYLIILLFVSTQKIICLKSVNTINNVTTKVLDRATGNLYIGLASGNTTDNAIMVLPRYNGYGNPASKTVVSQTGVAGSGAFNGIEFLALSTQPCSTNPVLVTTALSSNGKPQQQSQILAYSSGFATNGKSATGINLNDTTGEVTSGIVALAASSKYAYAAVKPTTTGTFGQPDSGLAATAITNNTNIGGSLILTQTNAQSPTPAAGISKLIDPSIDELKITTDSIITDTNETKPVLTWDEQLQRLYIGIAQITTDNSTGAGARSVIVANSQTNGVVNFAKIAPDGAFLTTDKTQIVGVITDNTDYLTIGVKNLKVMHTSTDKSYLIINGGNAPGTTSPTGNVVPGNTIYALPLVNIPGSTPVPNSIQGTLASYADPTFTTPAINPADMLTSQDIQSQVGAGPLPLLENQYISDMVVVGDTIYFSSANTQDVNTEPGVFYSQAMFDQYGRIYRWTPWTKRAFPYQYNNPTGSAFGQTGSQIAFMDVDAANGKIWAVGALSGTPGAATATVFTTNWDANSSSKNPTAMLGVLNKDFKCGCFCHLDLDQSTMGLAEQSPARYALFGGFEQVAFLRTSISLSPGPNYDKAPPPDPIPFAQSVIQDFSLPDNYLLTKLPSGAGCIKVLEYSRSFNDPAETKGYFFAGTQNGLYVFADEETGQGFAVGPTTNTLDDAPFTNSSWQKVLIIPESVIDMVSSGNALYVLTLQSSAQNPIINTLYKINFEINTDLMFAPSNVKIIAQNATSATNSDLTSAKMFYAIAVTTLLDNNRTYEQLLLATNNGIYRSNTFNSFGVNSADDQEQATWAPVNPDDTNAYTNIFSADNTDILYDTNPPGNNHITAFETVWPLQLANTCNCKTYEKNNIMQLNGSKEINGSTVPANPTFDPENFNADTFACTGACPQGVCQQNACGRQQGSCQNACIRNNSCANSNSCNNCANNFNSNNSASNCSTNYINSVNAKFETLDPINYFWSDGARRFFVIKRASDKANTSKLFVIPYNIQEWMVTDPKSQVISDQAIQNIKNFYWLGPIGVSGITLAGTSNGLVALE